MINYKHNNKLLLRKNRNKSLPFDVKIPNKKTVKAMHDADAGKTHKAKNVDALFLNNACSVLFKHGIRG